MASIALLMAFFIGQTAAPDGVLIITYERALEMAKEKNLDLKAAEARLEQANEMSRKAWAGYLPSITASGAYVRNQYENVMPLPSGYYIRNLEPGMPNPNGPTFDPTQPPSLSNPPGSPSDSFLVPSGVSEVVMQPLAQIQGQIQLNQALIVPSLFGAIRATYAAEKVARLNVENAQREVLFAVAQLYYGAVGLKQALDVQRRLLEANLAHERDANIRVSAGALPRIASIRAQIDRARAEQDVRRAENALAAAKIALATMLQYDGDFDLEDPPEPPSTSGEGELLRAAVEERRDVLAAKASVELAERQKNATRLQYLPSLVGSAAYRYVDYDGFVGEHYSWMLTLGLSWTLWDGGLRESTLRETEAKLVEARASARSSERQAIDEVRRTLLDLKSARANRTKAEEQSNLARENMRLVEVNYRSGVATQLDLTDATTQLGTAELGSVAERLNAQLAALRLLKAAGTFDP